MVLSIFQHLPDAGGPDSFRQANYLVSQCIQHNCLEEAVFLSELVHERVNNDETLLMFCDCLLRLSRTDEVYNLLFSHPKVHPRIRFLFAKCCFDLQKYDECERMLIDDDRETIQLHPFLRDTATAPFAGNLLAMVLCETGKANLAKEESKKSVEANPFLWSSICKYIQVGGKGVKGLMKRPDGFNVHPTPQSKEVHKKSEKDATVVKKTPVISTQPMSKVAAPRKSKGVERMERPEARRSLRLFNQDAENAGSRGHSRVVTPRLSKTQCLRPIAKATETVSRPETRRSRDMKQPLASRSANAMRSLSSSNTSVASVASSSAETGNDQTDGTSKKGCEPVTEDLFISVAHFADIEEAIGTHDWQKALTLLGSVPLGMNKCSMYLLMRARVMFEMADYESTKDILHRMRRQFPYKIEGTELLSTAMWQLQDQHGLSSLAQQLTTKSRRRPQTWCVAGNCFSLQRQHGLAVECMERAVQLDPHFAYAYTLLGHELVFIDELDRAAKAFRRALSISPNDYRAWYGLGQVHQRKEELHLAQRNMAKAVSINPTSRGMLCSLAQVEQALSRPERAMVLLTKALELDPNDVACRFNRARLLFDMKQNVECVQELKKLKELSPDEAHIFHLLGKVQRRLGNTHVALLNYSWATEMDPRGEQMMAHGVTDSAYDDDSYSPDRE